jgi:glucose/arabinose dehydrogenase
MRGEAETVEAFMRLPPIFRAFSPLFLALLVGCGGDGDSTAPPAPTDTQPVFTSPTAQNVPENSSGVVYTATANPGTNGALSFSIAGGADAARFAITAAGALSFVAPPDFENPVDADRNNVYLVRIAFADSRFTLTADVAITVTDRTDGAFRVRRVGSGFSSPLGLIPLPDNSGRVLVAEQAGRIRILNPATGAIDPVPLLDIASTISSGGERGLLGLALAPDFSGSRMLYVNVTNLAGNTEIRRYQVPANNSVPANQPGDVILTFTQPFANHNGGWIEFGPDGFLYIGSGDGGSSGDPQDNAQNRNNLLGKILRIDVRGDDFISDATRDYAIPSGNPFASGGGAPEIYAFGLRNPFRASFDPVTGNLYIGDVGQNLIEEIDLIRPNEAGLNFGWARFEGTRTFGGQAPVGATPPVAEYSHGSQPTQGFSVTGGYVYRGPVESLQGQYIFADFVRPVIFSIPATSLVQGQTVASSAFTLRASSFVPVAGSINNVSSFGVDQARNLYIVDFDGEIYVIEPN